MFPEDILGVALVLGLMLGVAGVVALSRLSPALKILIYAALALRFAGSWLRYTVLMEFYGRGDARSYFATGLEYAERFSRFDFSPFVDPSLWLRGYWWGTSFVPFPSGIITSVIGPSFLGAFVAFSLLGFIGLVGFATAFHRAYPSVPVTRYVRWIWLFPSLWFWPSSVGKEAIVLLGLGLAVAGFIGRKNKISWPLLVLGVYFVFAIRPQVAAVVIFSFVLAHWLTLPKRWTPRRALQGVLILLGGIGGIWLSMNHIGIDGFDIEGVHGYLEDMTARSTSGSTTDVVGVNWIGIPLALVNILLRPFIWEANNMMMMFAALEVLLFAAIVFYRRQQLWLVLRNWRTDRFLALAVPFILIYATLLGMLTINLGIIARQRVFLYPFFFLLLEATPRSNEPKRPRVVPRKHPKPIALQPQPR